MNVQKILHSNDTAGKNNIFGKKTQSYDYTDLLNQQRLQINNELCEVRLDFGGDESDYLCWLKHLQSYALINADPFTHHYTIHNQIGSGKFSEVYRAKVQKDSLLPDSISEVAIKVINKESIDLLLVY